jgi:hypothetical protein
MFTFRKKSVMATRLYCPGMALGIAALALASIAHASPILTLFNTGVFADGSLEPDGTLGDGHYTLVSVPGGTSTIRARTAAGGFPIPPYILDDTLSRWIGPNGTQPGTGAFDFNGPGGLYDYQTTFDLTGFNPGSALLSGQWAMDNEGVNILINGVPTGIQFLDPSGTGVPFLNFSAFSISTGFRPGINTLDFIVSNAGNTADNPTALRVEISGTATLASAIPEPATLLLFGAGLAGLMLLRRKSA